MIKAGRLAEPYKGVIDCVWLIVLDTSQRKLLILRLKIKLRVSSNPTNPHVVNFSKNIAVPGHCLSALSTLWIIAEPDWQMMLKLLERVENDSLTEWYTSTERHLHLTALENCTQDS